MKNKKVLITGANGLVGNYMVQKCIDRGAFVTAVDIRQPDNQIEKFKDENYQFINADLREFSSCKRVVEGNGKWKQTINMIEHIAT